MTGVRHYNKRTAAQIPSALYAARVMPLCGLRYGIVISKVIGCQQCGNALYWCAK